MRQLTKAEQCRAMMYKRSIVSKLNYTEIRESLDDMMAMCSDIQCAEQDDDTLINAFDGNEDEAHEFILQFSDLEYDIENLQNQFDEMFGYSDDPERDFKALMRIEKIILNLATIILKISVQKNVKSV